MKVLVAAASRHGATAEIAVVIAEELRDKGHEAEVAAADMVTSVDGFEAVVIGSAIYMGHWMRAAREFADRHAAELRERPVWLFSSGPIGDPPAPAETPVEVTELVQALNARGHASFAGEVDRARLGLREKLLVKMAGAPEGDFRPWQGIRDWASAIAADLRPARAA